MTKLSVNVNKVATLRNSRGGNQPNLLEISQYILQTEVVGLTVHPRPDERHIRRQDVFDLKSLIDSESKAQGKMIEFNIEGYPTPDFLSLVKKISPTQVTLVPDPPEVLTSNAGWKLQENEMFLNPIIKDLENQSIRTSLFIDPFTMTDEEINTLENLAPSRAELYTEAFAKAFGSPDQSEITKTYRQCADKIKQASVELNAGHDLNQKNLGYFVTEIPDIKEVSIGHALFCESLLDGLLPTVKNYLDILKDPRGHK